MVPVADGLDSADVARAALKNNIVLAPGNVFSPSQSATSSMRFNVSQSLDGRIYDVLKQIFAEMQKTETLA